MAEQQWYREEYGSGMWELCKTPVPGSVLANVPLEPGEIHDDGFGNRYRYEVKDDG